MLPCLLYSPTTPCFRGDPHIAETYKLEYLANRDTTTDCLAESDVADFMADFDEGFMSDENGPNGPGEYLEYLGDTEDAIMESILARRYCPSPQ